MKRLSKNSAQGVQEFKNEEEKLGTHWVAGDVFLELSSGDWV